MSLCFQVKSHHPADSLESFTHSSKLQVGDSPSNARNEKDVTSEQTSECVITWESRRRPCLYARPFEHKVGEVKPV